MKYIIFIAFSLCSFLAQAQKPTVKPKPIAKGPAAKLTATIAGLSTGTYGLGAAKIMIDSSLVLKDEKGKKYPISRCTFMYKRKNTYEDEITGEKKVSWEYLSKELRNNEQLDEFWRKTIKEDLKKGEELIFERILGDSQKGYMIPVKGIIITVQ
jgi:hypothetical protein